MKGNHIKMELKTAIEVLGYHQEWRLGNKEEMINEPKKLTEAIDVILAQVKKRATKVNWIKTQKDNLPNDRQRVLFYRESKLTKIGEMVFFDSEPDRTYFIEDVLFWSDELETPFKLD